LTKVTLVQVGDIHYPDWTQTPYETDEKDKKLSAGIRAGVTHAPMRLVLGKLASLAEHAHTAAVAFMGDFTSRGQKAPLAAALSHMSWLCRADRGRQGLPTLLLVPGNHDVSKADAVDLGQAGKFEAMAKLAEAALFEPMPVEGHVAASFSATGGGKVSVFLLNTTLGSWEPYLLPEPLEAAVNKAPDAVPSARVSDAEIAVAGASANPEPLGYYDQLDTPYVSARSLQELREAVRATPRGDAIVIIGHHNLLPQEQPRLSNYAELINAGYFRRFLLSLDRPIVYLHGHTHKDTVEEVVDPRKPRSRVVCIAAPKLEDGFNEISFHFDARGGALGLRLLPWRLAGDRGSFNPVAAEQAALSLINGVLRPSKDAHELHDKLTSTSSDRFHVYDIEDLAEGVAVDILTARLLELFFWRWIDISNVAAPWEEWVVTPRRLRA
jgi:hypothetical protein